VVAVTKKSVDTKHRVRPAWLLAAGAALFTGTIAVRASAPPQQAAQTAKPAPQSPASAAPEDEDAFAAKAEETMEKVCITCHPFEQITRARRTDREWKELLARMAILGAAANEQQFAMVKKYLVRWYGLVRVNTATAAELSAVLGLSIKDGAAIVAYRKANGKFANAAALAKVEGIDKAKIEEQPEALRFD
jgi:competence ComEA-like helix-hairpin-helix protein